MMKIYNSKNLQVPVEENGYFNCWKFVEEHEDDFNLFIFIGGRRLGKTFSVLRGLVKASKQHMYVRRTDSDLEASLTVKKNPYKAINNCLNTNVRLIGKGKEINIVECDEEDEPINYIGIASSVSMAGSVRGAHLEDNEYIIYDEFINMKPVNTLKKKEGDLFFNLYDTVNNDRDLRGKKPLKAILLSNANTIDDGLLRSLKIGHVIYTMIKNDENYYADYDRKIYISLLPSDNEITNRRRKSAIGKMTEGTTYSKMSMDNAFTDSYFGDIKEKVKFNEYRGLCQYENIYFYIHKSSGDLLASYRKCTVPKYTKNILKQFKRDYGLKIGIQFESGRLKYHNYDVKLDVMNIL